MTQSTVSQSTMVALHGMTGLRRLALCLACLVPLAAQGCGVSAYETEMEETKAVLKHKAIFAGLRPKALELPANSALGVKLFMRLPEFFQEGVLDPAKGSRGLQWMAKGSVDPKSQIPGEKIKDDRVLPPPPLINIPGYVATLEQYAKAADGGTFPAYLYVGIEPTPKDAEAAGELERIQSELKAAFPNLAPERISWEMNKNLETLDRGAFVSWSILQMSSSQRFYPGGTDIPTEPEGTYKIMCRDVDGFRVYLGWRIKDNAVDKDAFLRMAESAAATLSIEKTAVAAAQ